MNEFGKSEKGSGLKSDSDVIQYNEQDSCSKVLDAEKHSGTSVIYSDDIQRFSIVMELDRRSSADYIAIIEVIIHEDSFPLPYHHEFTYISAAIR